MKPPYEMSDSELDAWITQSAHGNIGYSLNDGLAERERRRALRENKRMFRIGFASAMAAIISATTGLVLAIAACAPPAPDDPAPTSADPPAVSESGLPTVTVLEVVDVVAVQACEDRPDDQDCIPNERLILFQQLIDTLCDRHKEVVPDLRYNQCQQYFWYEFSPDDNPWVPGEHWGGESLGEPDGPANNP